MLPAAIPNLIVNGTTGIAVGMATNIAPHNLVEVVQALRHLINHPDTDLDGLMRFIPGPDLPTGGKIVGLDGIRDAYETGRGTFRMRATARVESVTPRRKGIVVTELPYGVGTEKVIERIKVLVQGKKLQGISDIKDLTDREKGLRLVIEVKNGFHPEALLEQLYKQTPMEDTFGINTVALVDGQPRTLGLKEMLEVFLEHRFDVVRRRSQFRRNKKAERLHLVDGLLIALLDIDEVIQVIRTSDDAGTARERLMSVFDLSEAQADYILEMQLRRLTRFSPHRAGEGAGDAAPRDRGARRDPRRRQAAAEGRLRRARRGRQDLRHPAAHRAAGVRRHRRHLGRRAARGRRRPVLRLPVLHRPAGALHDRRAARQRVAAAPTTTWWSPRSAPPRAARSGVVTSRGRLVKLSVLDLPAIPASANDPNLQGGVPLSEVLSLESRRAGARADRARRPTGPGLALGTRQGVVKRVNPEVLGRDEWEVVSLKDGDEVVGALDLATGPETLCFITSDAQLLHFGADGVRPAGPLRRRHRRRPPHRGPAASRGSGRWTPPTPWWSPPRAPRPRCPAPSPARSRSPRSRSTPPKGRATGGVRCHRFLKGEDALVFAWAGTGTRPRGRHQRRARGPPRGQRPAGRLGRARQPADRGLRRPGRRPAGHRRCGRLRACRPVPASRCARGGRAHHRWR